MIWNFRTAFVILVFAAVGVRQSSGAAPDPRAVEASIARAQAWILAQQNNAGTWEQVARPQKTPTDSPTDLTGHQWGGPTALAAYALLESGSSPATPQMQKALHFLAQANVTSTYGLGLSSQVAAYMQPADRAQLVSRNVALLLAGMHQPPASELSAPSSWRKDVGFYSYWTGGNGLDTTPFAPQVVNARNAGSPNPRDQYDRSNANFAVMGMQALQEAGGQVPPLYWQIVDAAWRRAQFKDGGWNYNDNGADTTVAMTAAGIATLAIARERLPQTKSPDVAEDLALRQGLEWLATRLRSTLGINPAYTRCELQRVALETGRRRFGNVDLDAYLLEPMLSQQRPDGSWGNLADTALNLICLAQSRRPVLFSKLDYGGPALKGAWDQRPSDVKHLTRFVARELQRPIEWQVVDLDAAGDSLNDAPILFLSGKRALEFDKADDQKLRTFVERGGLIVGNDENGSPGIFTKSFEALGKRLFPKYAWAQTPPNDFIYNEQYKKFRIKPKVMELANGVRKLMLILPEFDPGRAWQTQSGANKDDLFGLGDNLALYAIDKTNLMTKGDSYLVVVNPKIPTLKSIKVARLDVGENADPEPGGWPRMIAVMHNVHKTDVKVEMIKPESLTANAKVADLTGTGKVTLSPAARSAIKQFVEGGGTLIVDAAGGDVTFAESAQNELAATFGESSKLELLAPEHPVYHEPGDVIGHVGWREFAIDKISGKRTAKLEGITFGKRVGVFFSRYDISAGLVGEPVDGIYGYDPQTATDLMAAMLMYAENGGAALMPSR